MTEFLDVGDTSMVHQVLMTRSYIDEMKCILLRFFKISDKISIPPKHNLYPDKVGS